MVNGKFYALFSILLVIRQLTVAHENFTDTK